MEEIGVFKISGVTQEYSECVKVLPKICDNPKDVFIY